MAGTVTIIGAGIVGICCGLSLQERGVPVRLIDRAEPGQETSYGNAGVISPWSIIPMAVPGIWKSLPGMLLSPDGPLHVQPRFWPRMIPWGLRFLRGSGEVSVRRAADAMEILCGPSVTLYRRHLAGTGHEGLVVDSLYVHAFRQAEKARLQDLGYAIRQSKGADLELIGADGLRAMEPALSRDFRAAVLIKGQARARAPGRIAEVLVEKFVQAGGEVLRANVTGLRRGPGGTLVVITDTAEIAAPKVILAAGVWSAELLASLGVKVPLVAERGYHVEFPKAGVGLENSVMDVDAKIVASSMEGGVRVAGSSEFAATDAPANPRRVALLRRQAKAMLPDLGMADMKSWLGRRPSFPDSLPALGPVTEVEGLYAAFGHAHYGLMMAPKTGELVADLITGAAPNIDLSAFDPARFRGA